ncbi:unnamed protein product [Protopolystoma xenopodis]|uniref:Uncharacterized protein n=1 Tax=Protopolystoma xenopodis TaxID=117903 RepID=A0A3S5BM25_9PLAT|nr:unnamed protein product [Protopolystoma xenopodis]
MAHSSDDVQHMMDESSARFHPKRGRKPRGLRQHEYHIKAKRLQDSEIHPSSSADSQPQAQSPAEAGSNLGPDQCGPGQLEHSPRLPRVQLLGRRHMSTFSAPSTESPRAADAEKPDSPPPPPPPPPPALPTRSSEPVAVDRPKLKFRPFEPEAHEGRSAVARSGAKPDHPARDDDDAAPGLGRCQDEERQAVRFHRRNGGWPKAYIPDFMAHLDNKASEVQPNDSDQSRSRTNMVDVLRFLQRPTDSSKRYTSVFLGNTGEQLLRPFDKREHV